MNFKKNTHLYKLYYMLKTFKQTAHVEYGPGTLNLVKKFYFSFLRNNIFEVFIFKGPVLLPELPGGDNGIELYDFSRLDKYRISDDVPKELCCDKMHAVTSCHIVEIDNELAYIHWVYTKGDHSRFIQLGDYVAEINNVLTLPKFRGKKISTGILQRSASKLQQEGYRKVVAVIHSHNIASIKSFTRAGFVKTDVIRSWGPFNRKISI